jgi:hypothetical protein
MTRRATVSGGFSLNFDWTTAAPAVGGLIIIGVLAVPIVRCALESRMPAHMLLQIPLLAFAGVGLALSIPQDLKRRLATLNERGIPGVLLASLAWSYWMLPRALDSALVDPWMELAKFTMLPLLVGAPLALSLSALSFVGRGFVFANTLSMLAVLGWLYRESPVRLCNYYLVDQQVVTGNWLVFLTGLAGLICLGRLILQPH